MSYQVLARKWRPRNFHEMVGQEHVLRALVNALDNDRLHHAYLFTGTRGVGKTTIARILAKSLNCEKGVTSEPCGRCSACTEIDEGRFVDLIEVDAASRTKVDETRELLDNVQYAPTRGRYKVYLIDEVHMFSNHSFNALLKTLEEPPPHVKFLLATTDPQKLPVTILSRCLQFNLKRMPLGLISDHLTRVLGEENIEAQPGAVRQLAQAADGSMRDALSLLDQAIAYSGGAVDEAEVRTMLGTIERGYILDILRALGAGDGAALLAAVATAAERSPDYAGLLAELLTLLQQIALAQAVPGAVDEDLDEREAVLELAGSMAPEDVQLFYQIGLLGRRDLPLSPDPRGGLEMALLRMLAFRPAATGAAAPGAAPAQARSAGAPPAASSAGGVRPQGSSQRPADQVKAAIGTSGAAQARAAAGAASSAAARATTAGESAPPAGPAASPAASAPPPAAPAGGGELTATNWGQVVEQLGLRGMANELAQNCAYHGRDGTRVLLGLDPAHKNLLGKDRETRLSEALGRYLGEPVQAAIQLEGAKAETPAQAQARQQDERQQAAVEAIQQDDNVKALEEAFDAQVRTESIQPVE